MATPLVTVAEPIVVPPTWKATVPVAVGSETVAVRVKAAPVLTVPDGDDVMVVVVAVLTTAAWTGW